MFTLFKGQAIAGLPPASSRRLISDGALPRCDRAFLRMVVVDASSVGSTQVQRYEQLYACLCVGFMSCADIEHAYVVARFAAYKTFALVYRVCRIWWRKLCQRRICGVELNVLFAILMERKCHVVRQPCLQLCRVS